MRLVARTGPLGWLAEAGSGKGVGLLLTFGDLPCRSRSTKTAGSVQKWGDSRRLSQWRTHNGDPTKEVAEPRIERAV